MATVHGPVLIFRVGTKDCPFGHAALLVHPTVRPKRKIVPTSRSTLGTGGDRELAGYRNRLRRTESPCLLETRQSFERFQLGLAGDAQKPQPIAAELYRRQDPRAVDATVDRDTMRQDLRTADRVAVHRGERMLPAAPAKERLTQP